MLPLIPNSYLISFLLNLTHTSEANYENRIWDRLLSHASDYDHSALFD
jgi:hypothetical protein